MRKKIKKYILPILILFWAISFSFAMPPSFDNNFADYLTDNTPDQYWRVESVFSFSDCIRRDQTISQNIRNILYPSTFNPNPACSSSTGWILWDIIRVVSYGLIFLFIVLAWVKFIMEAKEADWPKKAAMSLMYVLVWSFLVFACIWILWYVINIESIKWSTDLVNNLQNNLFLQILWFLKVLAFFLAIIMMVVAWFKMMSAMDKAEKAKEWQKWIINIIVALVFIKIIDYVFYIAQLPDFAQRAADLIVSVAKIMWWVMWFVFVMWLFYAGYSLFLSWWEEKSMTKSKWILMNIFVVSLVVFLFLLIVYEIFNKFAN